VRVPAPGIADGMTLRIGSELTTQSRWALAVILLIGAALRTIQYAGMGSLGSAEAGR
jgi:hypothetical protein